MLFVHTLTFVCMYCTFTHTHTHVCLFIPTYIHAHAHMHPYAFTYTFPHTCIHTSIPLHKKHTHTHNTHTHPHPPTQQVLVYVCLLFHILRHKTARVHSQNIGMKLHSSYAPETNMRPSVSDLLSPCMTFCAHSWKLVSVAFPYSFLYACMLPKSNAYFLGLFVCGIE